MTRAELQARLDAYLVAELAILQGQEYQIGSGNGARRLRRADLEQVRAEIASIRAELGALDARAAGVRRIRYVRPRY